MRSAGADVDAAHVGVNSVPVPAAALNGDQADGAEFFKNFRGFRIAFFGIHVYGSETFCLEITFAEAVGDNHGAEAKLFQGLCQRHGAERAVGLRESRDVKAGGEEHGAPSPAEDFPGGPAAVIFRKELPENGHAAL